MRNQNYCKMIFAKFDCLYPNLWAKQFNNCADQKARALKIGQLMETWGNLINSLSDEAISRGMKRICDGKSPFTNYFPNPLQFHDFCKNLEPREPSLPKLTRKGSPMPEELRDYVRKWKKMLGKGSSCEK